MQYIKEENLHLILYLKWVFFLIFLCYTVFTLYRIIWGNVIMKKNVDLLHGPVLPALTKLAVPIMATSLIQMAYNLTDMIWIGRIGSDAVASVGAAGMYMWLSNGLATLSRMGGQVHVGHSLGAGNRENVAKYTANALQLTAIFGLIFGALCVIFASPLIAFFKLNSPEVVADARIYLQITCGLVVFSFFNQTFTGIFTAAGNSRCSFFSTTVGLIVNIVLDPVLIFGIGPFPEMGVMGAAIATVLAQFIVFLMFIFYAVKDTVIFENVRLLCPPDKTYLSAILRIGLPSSVQSMIFTGISMVLARLVAGYGDAAVAIQKVGSQIESISWMTADGFAAAVNSFIAQNHGAGNKHRIRQGYLSAMKVVLVWGIVCTLLLTLCPEPIFRVFITEKDVIPLGVDYLMILGASQLFMSVEITTAGAFAGYGRTLPPSIVSIVFTSMRIPLALLLVQTTLALNGIWWSVTISSIIKGIVLLLWFLVFLKRQMRQAA